MSPVTRQRRIPAYVCALTLPRLYLAFISVLALR